MAGRQQDYRSDIIEADVRYLLKNMLAQHIVGENYAAPFNEAISNSIDAEAKEIFIRLVTHNKKAAICIIDTGKGFSTSGIASALNYAKSNKSKDDLKTIGKNGTGLKSLLTLGNPEEVRVEIFTMSDDYPAGAKIVLDFEFLVSIYENKNLKISDYVNHLTGDDRHAFYQGLKRERGSTIMITGFDPEKIKDDKSVVSYLTQRISPRAAKLVKVWKSGAFASLETNHIQGEPFYMEFNAPELGDVVFDLYYNGPNDGPLICGELNTMMRYRAFLEQLGPKGRKLFPKVWGSVGGWVYIQGANKYRGHDGSFEQGFRDSGALAALTEMFQVVGSEIMSLQESQVDQKKLEENLEILKTIAAMNQPENMFPVVKPGSKSGQERMPLTYGAVDVDHFIVPSQVMLYQNSSREILLRDLGRKGQETNFGAAQWNYDSKKLLVVGNGGSVTLNANNALGQTTIKVKGYHSNFEHAINVIIQERPNNIFIDGPRLVNPGTENEYSLEAPADGDQLPDIIQWKIAKIAHVSVVANGSKVLLCVAKEAPTQSVELYALDKKGKILAVKKIQITDKSGNRPIITRIGMCDYILTSSVSYPTCAVQYESADDSTGLPVLHINPHHPAIKMAATRFDVFVVMASGMAAAAVAHQTADQIISAEKGMNIFWEFVGKIKEHLSVKSSKKH